MSTTYTVNGVAFPFPTRGDSDWSQQVNAWAGAVSASALYKAGGTFTLTAEVDFGANHGLKSTYFKSRTASAASAGALRLAHTDALKIRNFANDGDVAIGLNDSNELCVDDTPLGFSTSRTFSDTDTINLTVNVNDVTADVVAGSLSNTHLAADAAIATSKLAAVAASKVLVSDGSGFVSASGISTTTLGYLDATSSIQTQLDGKITAGTAAIVNADVNASAAIDLSKLAAVAASKVLVSDGSGFVSASGISTTTLGYLDATSSIQTQLDSKASINATNEFSAVQGSTESTPASSSGALTLDFAASNYFEVTLTENITSITINNTGIPGPRTILFKQSSANTYTVTGWPSVTWISGTAPVITTGAGASDLVTIWVDSAGAKRGSYAQAFA